MDGQFTPENRWSVCSGKWAGNSPFQSGQFAPESGGQFDRILQVVRKIPSFAKLYFSIKKKTIIYNCDTSYLRCLNISYKTLSCLNVKNIDLSNYLIIVRT